MSYKYIPETINFKLYTEKYKDYDSFLQDQILYRQIFEEYLRTKVSFEEIDKYIETNNISIPLIEDKDINFYHKFSHLGSNYLFLRNNIHVEKLNPEEIIELHNLKNPEQFILKTYEKVLYEDGDFVFAGVPMDETLVASKSIFFEFAFQLAKIEDIKTLKEIKKIETKILAFLKTNLDFNQIGLIEYNGMSKYLYVKNEIKEEFI